MSLKKLVNSLEIDMTADEAAAQEADWAAIEAARAKPEAARHDRLTQLLLDKGLIAEHEIEDRSPRKEVK